MFRNAKFVALLVTAYLIIYQIMIFSGVSLTVIALMYLFSPLLVIWLAFVVLKFDKFDGKVLKENEEWGYQDRERDSF